MAEQFGWQEAAARAVLVLETAALPDWPTYLMLAAACGLRPENLAILAAPTSSLAGSVQIAARSVETALHKLHHLGFDIRKVVDAVGRCPLSPPTGDDFTSLGKPMT